MRAEGLVGLDAVIGPPPIGSSPKGGVAPSGRLRRVVNPDSECSWNLERVLWEGGGEAPGGALGAPTCM